MENLHLESSYLIDVAEVECYKLYPKRWIILIIYALIVMSNLIQSQEYVSVTDTIIKYYDISIEYNNWSSMINLVVVVITMFPSIFFIQRIGLRNSIVIGAIGTSAGAWIKVAGVAPNRFWVVILGQAVNAVFQSILVISPAKLAAVWFGAKEISTACSIGMIAVSVAFAMGYLIPTSVLTSTNSFEIERGLYLINISYAIVPSILVPISFCYSSERPPTSPNRAQTQIDNLSVSVQNFGESMKSLLKNGSFLFVTVSNILNVGVFNAFSTMLNPIIIKHYPNATQEVGIIALVMFILGGFGLIITGILLDKFCRYKFLISAYGLICMQLGVELTYPQEESNISGILGIGSQLCGLILTYLYTFLFNNCNELVTNLIFTGIIIFGDILLLFVKFNLKRQCLLRVN